MKYWFVCISHVPRCMLRHWRQRFVVVNLRLLVSQLASCMKFVLVCIPMCLFVHEVRFWCVWLCVPLSAGRMFLCVSHSCTYAWFFLRWSWHVADFLISHSSYFPWLFILDMWISEMAHVARCTPYVFVCMRVSVRASSSQSVHEVSSCAYECQREFVFPSRGYRTWMCTISRGSLSRRCGHGRPVWPQDVVRSFHPWRFMCAGGSDLENWT